MPGRRQPLLGITATALVIAVSLAFVGLFDWPTFRDWVSFFLICTIPFAFVAGPFWKGEHPRVLRALPQPWQGLALLAVALMVGAVVAVVLVATVGGGITPPSPMVAQCVIVSVPITFFLVVVWGGRPFTKLTSPVLGGVALLVVAYAITGVVFRLFNYDFLVGAPVYSAAQDPKGPFDAWTALVFVVTCMAAALLVAHFDLWPISLRGGLMAQPVLGLCWTALAVTLSAIATYLGIHVLGMAPPQFLVTVTVPFLFGSIVVLNMLEATCVPGAAPTRPRPGGSGAGRSGGHRAGPRLPRPLGGGHRGRAYRSAGVRRRGVAGLSPAGSDLPVPGLLRRLLRPVAAAAGGGSAARRLTAIGVAGGIRATRPGTSRDDLVSCY